MNVARIHQKQDRRLSVVSSIENHTAVIVSIAADVITVVVGSLNLGRVGIGEFEPRVERVIVVRDVSDTLRFWLDIVSRIRFVPLLDPCGLLPCRIGEIAVDDDRSGCLRDLHRRTGGRQRSRGGEHQQTVEDSSHRNLIRPAMKKVSYETHSRLGYE